MAADAEIQVLIEVVDQMSDKLKSIEKTVGDFSNTTAKQAINISQSFQETTNALLALGNTAQAVDRIFSAYQNQQIRLENSTERVMGAQDRLEDAQRRLNRVMRDGQSSAEDVADAQREVERSSRTLRIAQNNLERAQNAVIGTYLSMGTSAIQLIGSLPSLIRTIRNMQLATRAAAIAQAALNALMNPFIALATIAIAATAAITIKNLLAADSTADLAEQQLIGGQTVNFMTNQMISQVNVAEQLQQKMAQVRAELDAFNRQYGGGESPFGLDLRTGKTVVVPSTQPFGPGGLRTPDTFRLPTIELMKPETNFQLKTGEQVRNEIPQFKREFSRYRPGMFETQPNVVINLNGDVYGINATDISRALKTELASKISI